MDIALLQQTLREFAAERDWQPFHTPKNLAMALMVEAAELAEIFQWMTPEQSVAASRDKVEQERIGDEVADVLLYLLQLADHCGVDLKRAVGRKLVKNASKHPPLRPGLPAGPVLVSSPATHVLVDWENVQPKDTEILALVPDATDVWIFHGKAQKKVDANQKAFTEHLTLVPISRSGKNALDFHLSFYMGYITSRNPDAHIVVIANDQGYGPMLEHANELGFDSRQVGFASSKKQAPAKKVLSAAPVGARSKASTEVATKKVAAKKVVAKKAVVRKVTPPAAAPNSAPRPSTPVAKKQAVAKKVSAASTTSKPAKTPQPAGGKSIGLSAKDYEHVLKSIRKSKNKPARVARLNGAVKSLIAGGKADDSLVAAAIDRLVADGHVVINAKGAVVINPA